MKHTLLIGALLLGSTSALAQVVSRQAVVEMFVNNSARLCSAGPTEESIERFNGISAYQMPIAIYNACGGNNPLHIINEKRTISCSNETMDDTGAVFSRFHLKDTTTANCVSF